MKSWYVIIAVVAAGGAVAFHAVNEQRHQTELAEIRAHMSSLSTSVEEAREAANRPAPVLRAPVLPAPQPVAEPEDERDNGEAPEREAQDAPPPPGPEPAQMKAELETTFASERTDPTWSSEAQREARARITAALPETSTLRDVDCHASLCRIETSHADLMSYQRFVQGAFMNPETRIWNAGFFSSPPVQGDNGQLVATMYVAREGEPLPLSMLP